MGKRKSTHTAAQSPARRPRHEGELAKSFRCPFCNHDDSVEVHMDRKSQIGEAACRVCSEKFRVPIHSLSDPIDVYCAWIDECERVNGGTRTSI